MTNLLDNKTVRVLDVEIQGIEYKGQRVVTFKQIDEVHKRKEGTAKNSFYENKERFVESKHYFEIGRLEIPTDLWEAYGFNKFAPKGYLITERGYLFIAKTLTDDRAWEIQEELIESYFRKSSRKALADMSTKELALIDLSVNLEACKLFEIPTHIAQIESVKETRKAYNIDFSNLLQFSPAKNNILEEEIMLEPTELGKCFGMSAREMNNKLCELGLQSKINGTWQITDKGKCFCSKHSWIKGSKNGYNYKWNKRKVELEMAKATGVALHG